MGSSGRFWIVWGAPPPETAGPAFSPDRVKKNLAAGWLCV